MLDPGVSGREAGRGCLFFVVLLCSFGDCCLSLALCFLFGECPWFSVLHPLEWNSVELRKRVGSRSEEAVGLVGGENLGIKDEAERLAVGVEVELGGW